MKKRTNPERVDSDNPEWTEADLKRAKSMEALPASLRSKLRGRPPGRLLEVTAGHELVWEYISPYRGSGALPLNLVYRAYRAPYEWLPQRPRPDENPVAPLDITRFRVPGAAPPGRDREVEVAGVQAGQGDESFCVAPSGEGAVST